MKKYDKCGKIEFDFSSLDEACNTEDTKKKKPDLETRIYNFLNTVEIIAVKLAQINQILKKAKKNKKKKFKKLGKVDKKTGTLILKGQKKPKKIKSLGKYKAKRK